MSKPSSIVVLTLVALGCSSADEPTPYVGYGAGVPLLVTNGGCIGGGECPALRILALAGRCESLARPARQPVARRYITRE